jgi:hypothetical protein
MIRRILSLVYEFELPNNMNIHPVISVTYLELVLKDNDSYNRFRNDYSASVEKDPWNNVEKK